MTNYFRYVHRSLRLYIKHGNKLAKWIFFQQTVLYCIGLKRISEELKTIGVLSVSRNVVRTSFIYPAVRVYFNGFRRCNVTQYVFFKKRVLVYE